MKTKSCSFSFKVFFLFACIICMLVSAHAGDKITIRLQQLPSNKLGTSDLWKMSITNSTHEMIKIYLTGNVSETKKGIVVTGKSKVFSVAPGTKTYSYEDFKNGEVSWKNKSVEESVLRTGNAPEGEYTICAAAFFESGDIADQESCIEQAVRQTGSISLISPADGDETDITKPLIFTWTPLQGAKIYRLKIVELRGSQSPDAALKENRPILDKDGIKITSYQYSNTDPKLDEGKKYVWAVSTDDNWSEPFVVKTGTNQKITNELLQVIELIYPKDQDEVTITVSGTGNWGGLGTGTLYWGSSYTTNGNGYGYKQDGNDYSWGSYDDATIDSLKPHYFDVIIKEMKKDQTPESAMKENEIFHETKDIRTTSFKLNEIPLKMKDGSQYVWMVKEGDSQSKIFTFKVRKKTAIDLSNFNISLIYPQDGGTVFTEGGGNPVGDENGVWIRWAGNYWYTDSTWNKWGYDIIIKLVLAGQSPKKAMDENEIFFQTKVDSNKLRFSSITKAFEDGKQYVWQVKSGDVESSIFTFNVKKSVDIIKNAPDFEIILDSPIDRVTVCLLSHVNSFGYKIDFSWRKRWLSNLLPLNDSNRRRGDYDLIIKEMLSGQTPKEALDKNEIFFESKVDINKFRFSSGTKNFEDGKQYVWMVKSGNVESEIFTFRAKLLVDTSGIPLAQKIVLDSPSDGESREAESYNSYEASFYGNVFPDSNSNDFQLIIKELLAGQTRKKAMDENEVFYEMKNNKSPKFDYPENARKFADGKQYVWMVKNGSVESEIFTFNIKKQSGLSETSSSIALVSPKDNDTYSEHDVFAWREGAFYGNIFKDSTGFQLIIKELLAGQSPKKAMNENKTFYEENNIKANQFQLTAERMKFELDKQYVWKVKRGRIESEIFTFRVMRQTDPNGNYPIKDCEEAQYIIECPGCSMQMKTAAEAFYNAHCK